MSASTTASPATHASPDAFRHEALLYSGDAGFLDGTLPFVREGVAAGEPVLVVVSAERIRGLRSALGDDADRVCFTDMAEVGKNPARIIPAWRAFLDDNGGGTRRLRGIGEPIWSTRSPAELAECQRHEALLNVAFVGSGPWWLLCPYDVASLPADVIHEAERTHPYVAERGSHRTSHACRDLEAMAAPFDAPLPPPPVPHLEMAFDADDLPSLRRLVADRAGRVGLAASGTDELVLAVHEVAANSVRHGGGRGVLRIWQEDDRLVCEVTDSGHIVEPLIGREQPPLDGPSGRGLWLVNQLCDLVQLRSYPHGTVVRIHARCGDASPSADSSALAPSA